MISERTLNLVSCVFVFGSLLRCIPYEWNPEKKQLKLQNDLYWHYLRYFNFFGNITVIICNIFQILTHDFNITDLSLGTIGISILFISMMGQVHMWVLYKDFQSLFNTIIFFNMKRMNNQNNKKEKDGMELLILCVCIFTGLDILCLFPIIFFLVNANYSIGRYWNFGNHIYNLIGVTFFIYILLVDIIIILFYVFSSFIYINSIAIDLKSMRLEEKPNKNAQVKNFYQHQIWYRSHQVLNRFAIEVSNLLAGSALFVTSIIMISSFFVLVKLFQEMNTMVLIILCSGGFVTLLAVKMCIEGSAVITDNSTQYLSSYSKYKKHLRPIDRSFLISCTPLYIWAGSWYKITRETFTGLVFDFVLKSVIDLLMTFK